MAEAKATVAAVAAVVAQHSPPTEAAKHSTQDPQLVGAYKALVKAAVRKAATLDSEKTGDLQPGEVVEVLESTMLGTGQIRLRFDRGWTSLSSKAGKKLMLKVGKVLQCPSSRSSPLLRFASCCCSSFSSLTSFPLLTHVSALHFSQVLPTTSRTPDCI